MTAIWQDRSPRWGAVRRRRVALVLVLSTAVAGVVWRMAPLGLGGFAWKYGGSALYASLGYWLMAAGWPRARSWRVGLGALAAVEGVELFKLVRLPALDAFRLTLMGKLVLGRVFTWGAVVAYACGVAVVCGVDEWRRGR